MTAPRLIEKIVSADRFTKAPVAGDYFTSQSGLTLLAVTKVRRMVDTHCGLRYRLMGMRVKLTDVPAGIEVQPWPRKITPPPTPTADSFIGPPPAPRPILSTTTKRTAARRRAVELLRDDRDSNRVVHKVRVENRTVLLADWRDPDDLSPNRRTARVVHGYRARDSVQVLLDGGSISRGHAAAAKRFRKEYELGELGLRACRDLSMAPDGFASGTGPSESRMKHLQTYHATIAALLPHLLEIVIAIVIHDETIHSYAAKRRMNRQSISGYMLASFDYLRDYYQRLDEDRRRQEKLASAS